MKKSVGAKKKFFDFEWKKIILPVILILLFIFLLINFYNFGHSLDKYICQLRPILEEQSVAHHNNDSLALNQSYNKWINLSNNLKKELAFFTKITPVTNIFSFIDPFIPIPCEESESNFCRFYMGKESYICAKELIEPSTGIVETKLGEYQISSIGIILLNILYLLVIGYLFSCLVLYVCRRLKKKIK